MTKQVQEPTQGEALPAEQKKKKDKPQPREKNGKFMPDVRGKVRDAVIAMADEGISDNLAAKRYGIRIDNLRRATARPHVKAFFKQRLQETQQNSAQQAFMRNIQLSQTSDSDHVKADLNKWVAGVGGISPVQKVSGTMQHNHSFGGFVYDEPDTVDVTPNDTTSEGQGNDSQ